MTRTARLPLLAAALLSLLAPLAVTSTGAQAAPAPAAAPELHLSTLPGPGNPIRITRLDPSDPPPSPDDCIDAGGDRYGDECHNVTLAISATAPLADVTVTVIESRGLYVDPLVTTIDALETDNTEVVNYAVRGRSPGLHTLTFEVTAPGAEPRRVSLPYLWQSGGAPLGGNDSLSGRLYAQNFLDSYPCGANGDCTFRYSRRLDFLDAKHASTALAVNAKRACVRGTCSTYHYDKTSGLVQVGRFTIGRVTTRAAHFDGERYARMTYPRINQRLEGNWLFGANVDEGRGIVEQRLRLRSNGRFHLYYAVDTHRYPESGLEATYPRRMSGTYRIGRNGRLRLNDNLRKLTEVATLAVITTSRGRPRSGTKGIWLDVSVNPNQGKRFIDGNRLYPIPGQGGGTE